MDEKKTSGGAAKLYCVTPPDDRQLAGLGDFLQRTYGVRPQIEIIEDPSVVGGFRLEYGDNVFDWSARGRIDKLKEDIRNSASSGVTTLLKDAVENLKSTIENWSMTFGAHETGKVLTVGDGIARIGGLDFAEYGEIVVFESGVKGMVQELSENHVGCIVFGNDREVEEGDRVMRTGKTAGIPVGDGVVGRVIDALGAPLDGGAPVEAQAYMPIESPAPGIIDRQPVDRPLKTGIFAIDSMFPSGRG